MNAAFLKSAEQSHEAYQQALAALRVERGEKFSQAVDELFRMAMDGRVLTKLTKPKDPDLSSAIKSMIVHECLTNILATASVLAQKAFGLTDAEIREAVDVAEGMVSKVTADAEAASAILKAQASTH